MVFLKGFQLFDDTVGIFGIILSYPCFNTGSTKQSHGSLVSINALADRFGQVDQSVEHRLQIRQEILLEACEFGSIGNDIKSTEIP